MNPRTLLNFFRSPRGRFVGFCLTGLILVAIIHGCKRRATDSDRLSQSANALAKFMPQSVKRKTVPLQAQPAPRIPQSPAPVPTGAAGSSPALAPINLYTASAAELPEPDLPAGHAPFGRLIPCELIITLESANIATPIIALVTKDLKRAGQIIVPAGAEVHGRAQVDRARDRIASQGPWTIVWPTGEELTVNGVALDHEEHIAAAENAESWDIRDGSAGLRGEILKSDVLAEWKLYLSAVLQGFAQGTQDRQTTLLGTQPLPTLGNAAKQGLTEVLTQYSSQLLQTMEREGHFVRVPAGKTFYLYVAETIDLSKARAGSTRQRPETRLDVGPATAAVPGSLLRSPFAPSTINPTRP